MDDDEDDEFEPITEEERRQILKKWSVEDNGIDEKDEEPIVEDSAESSEAEDSTEEEVETDEEDENAEVDPDVVSRMRAALGRVALTNEDQSDIVGLLQKFFRFLNPQI